MSYLVYSSIKNSYFSIRKSSSLLVLCNQKRLQDCCQRSRNYILDMVHYDKFDQSNWRARALLLSWDWLILAEDFAGKAWKRPTGEDVFVAGFSEQDNTFSRTLVFKCVARSGWAFRMNWKQNLHDDILSPLPRHKRHTGKRGRKCGKKKTNESPWGWGRIEIELNK